MQPYGIEISPAAQRNIAAIPPKYAIAIVEFITRALAENPQRVGKPLHRELEGLHSARRGNYRVLYRIDESDRAVLVARIQHRGSVYHPR